MRQLSRVGALLGSATAIVLVEGFDLPRGQNPTSRSFALRDRYHEPRPRPSAVVAAVESVVDDTTGPIVSVATAASSPSLGENVLSRLDALEKRIAADEISTKIDALRAEIVARSSRSGASREEILANVDELRKEIATRSTHVFGSRVPVVVVAAAAVPLVAAVAARSSRARRRERIEAERAAAAAERAAREERSDARAETSVARRTTDAARRALESASRLRADLPLSIASDDRRGTREVTGARLRAAELEDAVVDASSRIRRSVARTSRDHDADALKTIAGGIVAVGAASLVAGATAANREPSTEDGESAKVATPTTNNMVKPSVKKTTSDPPTARNGPTSTETTTTIAPPTTSPVSSALPDATRTTSVAETTTSDDVERIDVASPSLVDLGAVAFAGLVSLRSALVGSRIDREIARTTEEIGRVRADLDDAWRRATTDAARTLDASDVGSVDEAS